MGAARTPRVVGSPIKALCGPDLCPWARVVRRACGAMRAPAQAQRIAS
jgi:alkylated DNA nucleotide flippase Atl1